MVTPEVKNVNSKSQEKKRPNCYGRMDCLITGNCGHCEYIGSCYEKSFNAAYIRPVTDSEKKAILKWVKKFGE